MPIAKFDALLSLVESMSKAEKRHFSLYCSRLESNKNVLYLRLFHRLETAKYRSDIDLTKALGEISKTQYINAKRNLYTQILRSLRVLRDRSDKTFEQRQKLDYALLLYQRGLITESLLLLEKAKKSIQDNKRPWLYLEALELQKLIESRHITRSRQKSKRIESIIEESQLHTDQVTVETLMTNVSLAVQGFYNKMGFAKNDRDAMLYKSFFDSRIPARSIAEVSHFSKMLWCQSKVWENQALLKFQFSYKYALLWIETGLALPKSAQDVDLISRGYHYLLTACYYLDSAIRFEAHFQKWETFRLERRGDYNQTSELLDFTYFSNALLNRQLLLNLPSRKESIINKFKTELAQKRENLDQHRNLIFLYKLAMISSYKGDYESAIVFLNQILATQEPPLRSDVYNYARLILLLCHYKLNSFRLVINLIPAVKSAFESQARFTEVLGLLLGFLRKGCRAMNFGINELIDITFEKLESCRLRQFDKVDFVYYDFSSWVLSLKDGESIVDVRKRK